jgi:hypothetical protein
MVCADVADTGLRCVATHGRIGEACAQATDCESGRCTDFLCVACVSRRAAECLRQYVPPESRSMSHCRVLLHPNDVWLSVLRTLQRWHRACRVGDELRMRNGSETPGNRQRFLRLHSVPYLFGGRCDARSRMQMVKLHIRAQ